MSKARRQRKVWKILCDFTAGRLGRRVLSKRFLDRARRLSVRRPTREQAEVFRRMEQMYREMKVPRLTRGHVWGDFQGMRIRAVRGGIYITPREKPFHEYIVDHLLCVLGKRWFTKQVRKSPEERHVIFRWRAEIFEEARRLGATPNQSVAILPTGNMKSLLVLADDIWQLAQAGSIPRWMPNRLGHRTEFQGARYELAAAAAFVRAGFRLEFVEERSAKAPEFVAINRSSGEKVAAVEAKSPRRVGVLHEEPREGLPPDEVRAKVGRLLHDAFEQLGNVDCPALAFVDLNLPLSPGVPTREKPWFRDLDATVHYAGAFLGERRQPGAILAGYPSA